VENALVAHPAVAEAAVVAVSHPKWQERPLAVVVRKTGSTVTGEELRLFLTKTFAKWQVPDDFIFVSELPPHIDRKAAEDKIAGNVSRVECARRPSYG